jgi:integrase
MARGWSSCRSPLAVVRGWSLTPLAVCRTCGKLVTVQSACRAPMRVRRVATVRKLTVRKVSEKSQAELLGGRRKIKKPKSAASFVFVGPKGDQLRRHDFQKVWLTAPADAKITKADVHFHDLRHTGNDLAARKPKGTRARKKDRGKPEGHARSIGEPTCTAQAARLPR